MADNYIERQREQYEARKNAWLRNPSHTRQSTPQRRQPPMLHRFASATGHLPRPGRMNCPFCYTPHPLCVLAAHEVQTYLGRQLAWHDELRRGKMFGVLVVRTDDGDLGYLAAYSGILAGRNDHPYFVPPVYDLLRPDGYFKEEEARISALNHRIAELESSERHQSLARQATLTAEAARQALDQARALLKAAKQQRDLQRQTLTPDAPAWQALTAESQHQKAEYKRLERTWKARTEATQTAWQESQAAIDRLKAERKQRSADLQQWLFAQFRLLNAQGEAKDLCAIFSGTAHRTPPAGAGECCAPKLLQQAYLHHWKPLCMAEFWWGDSPQTEVRHHGAYYPACQGKCGPILAHMLQGLDVDPNPLTTPQPQTGAPALDIVYEDDYLLALNKPAGLLSVPGKTEAPSVYSLVRQHCPDAQGPLIVHRLDMATSGLLLVAKDKHTHQQLQAQFHHRQVKKRYVALLQGIVASDRGTIDLPLRPDPLDRPRQLVDPLHGKPALTHYEVLARGQAHTLVAFCPVTGRTHQLRMHAAHPAGLHCPIVGDELYGHKADRLYLHAEALELLHPVTGIPLRLTCPAPSWSV